MLVYLLFVFSLSYVNGFQANTTEGVVEGAKALDGDYYVFYGIPYAGPTSGQNRFKSPVPPLRYPGLFHAMDSNVICAQPTSRGRIGVEDCLTLSIFTKNATTPKPVIVWLNSDEYTNTNTQMFSFKRIVEQDVVFVPMNHRLSIFGFLCLGVPEAPGNAGLKDIIQGLRWIKSNIASFGGDPNNVILMGHASGAAMVDLLSISPLTENLIHKAVILSGSGISPWAVAYDPIGYAELFGTKLQYTGKNPSDLARLLVNTDINVLHTALNEFKFTNNTPLFAPCIENPSLRPNDTVLAEAPLPILQSGRYPQIPVIYGYTTREGTMRAEEAAFGNWLNGMQLNFTRFLQADLDFRNNETAEAQRIRDFYFGSSPVSMGTIEDYLDYQGDTLVLVSVIRAAKERASTSKSEVRLMEFGYVGTLNSDWIYNQIPLSGAKHGAFVNFLFDHDLRPVDETVSTTIVRRFARFAHERIPDRAEPNDWLAITNGTFNYLHGSNAGPTINGTGAYVEELKINPHAQRMSFWNSIYDKYYVNPHQSSSSSLTLSCVLFVTLCQLIVRMF